MNVITKKVLSGFLLLGALSLANADDTDIINIEVPVDSNVLFVMDMSGSMDKELTSDNPPSPYDYDLTRLGVLHNALRTVLTDPTLTDINVGIATFAGDDAIAAGAQVGHGISYPISPIDADAATRLDLNIVNNAPADGFDHQTDTVESGTITVTSYLPTGGGRTTRGYVGDAVPSTWTPSGGTPIVDALYEAARYFRGLSLVWGHKDPSEVRSAHPSSYTGMIYNKTAPSVTPVPQNCGRPSQPVCTGVLVNDPCLTVTQYKTCNVTDLACLADASAGGYDVCDTPVPSGGGFSNCSLATCQVTAGCDDLAPTPVNHNRECTLATENACETDNTWGVVGSCTPDTAQGPCNHWNDAGACDGWEPDVDIFNCVDVVDTFQCPVPVSFNQTCSRDVEQCQQETHPIVPTIEGSGTYKSPITQECAMNSIILLTDGKPTLSNSATRVSSLIGPTYAGSCSTSGGGHGRCGNELVSFLSSTDQSATTIGDQFVVTHTIGLALNDIVARTYLEDLAFNGGGFYVNATSPASLVTALSNALTVLPRARSFSSPTYTPDPSSLFAHGDYVYVPVFDRGLGPVWYGNFKKYKRVNGILEDADGLAATDPLGGIKSTARDFWSANPSTHSVKSGGVASKINPATRSAMTDNGTGPLILIDNSLPSAAFGPSVTAAYKDKLVKFIKGEKSDGSARNHMGDIIHSKAIHLTYAGNKQVLFIGTNEGYLHAINDSDVIADPSAGKELFAYMPRELLKNIDVQYRNDALNNHVYGVDGPITLSHDDTNHNNIVDGVEKAILYFGLRRGGQAYYALDVSNRLSPRLLWKKKRGDSGFSDLGFTWSQPKLAKMKVAGTTQEVLIFGGGYIDDNGMLGAAETDNGSTTRGSAVYIVKASDGTRLWSGDTSYAVPAGIRTLDVNKDGLVDRLYFADTGGNVWRVVFDSSDISSQAAVVPKKFANLSGSGRKFFVEPDVALFKHYGKYLISVALGSGERPKPLEYTSDDHFFVMFDTDPFAHPTSPLTAITKASLVNATTGSVTGVLAAGKKGWFKDLGGVLSGLTGEKVLSRATTYENMIFFNTFGTTSISASACGVSNVNQSRLYALDLITAGPVLDLDGDGTFGEVGDDESVKFAVGEIPGAPQIIFDKPESTSGGTCTQGDCIRPDFVVSAKGEAIPIHGPGSSSGLGSKLHKIYWLDKE